MPVLPVTPFPGSLGDAMLEDVARKLASANETIVIGADVADGSYGPRDWWSSVPDRIVSMSWSRKATQAAKTAFARFASNGRTKFYLRDRYSRDRLIADVPQAANCTKLTADLAFLAEEESLSAEWEKYLQNPVIAILPRKEFPEKLVQCVVERGFHVLVIQHDLRCGSPMSNANQKFFADAMARDQLRMFVPQNPQGYLQVRAILRRCLASLSGRLHGCISSMAVGAPAMMIAEYCDKSLGIFEPFALEWLVAESISEAEGPLERMIQSLPEIRVQISGKIEGVKLLARQTFE